MQQRRFAFSRFRLCQSLRDVDNDDGNLLTCAAFMNGYSTLVAGTASGDVKVYDAYTGEIIDLVEAHDGAINMLQVWLWKPGHCSCTCCYSPCNTVWLCAVGTCGLCTSHVHVCTWSATLHVHGLWFYPQRGKCVCSLQHYCFSVAAIIMCLCHSFRAQVHLCMKLLTVMCGVAAGLPTRKWCTAAAFFVINRG